VAEQGSGDPGLFRTILIANRGEIAVRVIRTCQELGIPTAVVYSTEDRDALATHLADRAVQIGPAPARKSYLNMAAIMEAAAQCGADAIHPGYGFLSEDADFASVCYEQGVTFIGPPPALMNTLADKAAARALLASTGLPVLPGGAGTEATLEDAERTVGKTGYPLIIKAAAGGGGRGMAVVRSPAGLASAYRSIVATAQQLFGDGSVYLERYLDRAKHIEVQVLCDQHGQAVYLGERDCSVQRRKQKLIEETPAATLARSTARALGEQSARGAARIGLHGASTFEFLVDDEDNYYFMEVNCRIQVEHPVTEMVSGLDIVAEQIKIAAGHPLSFRQDQVILNGHAIECRINAEDPTRGFLPTPGRLAALRLPAGPFTRVDSYVAAGDAVSPAYDSLIAKVITWGSDRESARARMARALREVHVQGAGMRDTSQFLSEIIDHPEFRAGRHITTMIDALGQPPAAAVAGAVDA
jgi:acetyl-CoA carboxylase, biotin carboxylase subunit